MKALIIGNEDRYVKYRPTGIPILDTVEMVFCPRGSSDEELLAAGRDANFIAADPMATVTGNVIRQMPNLKIIHTEGVGFNFVDLEAAKERGVYVCNCKGVNAGAVAEQTILLMLGLLRSVISGDRGERAGQQIQIKEAMMLHGIRELADCKVGLIGFGDIAKAVALRLIPFGCEVYYHTPKRKSEELETEYHVTWLPMEELVTTCDMVSLLTPVTPETKGMVDERFLKKMKRDAYLINTARGDLVDNDALRNALINGTIAGAGLDTVAPEPTLADNPVVALPAECADRVLFSPHIGGITESTFRRAHRTMWQAFDDVANGKRPEHVVNGV